MTIPLDLPEQVLGQLQLTEAGLDEEVRLMLAARMYARGLASTGRAAELLDVPRTLLLSRLDDFGVALYDAGADELRSDVAAASDHGR